MPAFDQLIEVLDMVTAMVSQVKVNEHILEDSRYDLMFSVEKVNQMAKDGVPFRDAYKQVGCTGYEFKNLKNDLQKIDLCHSRIKKEKYIPSEYLCASVNQRLELLAGLLDTDGTLRNKENRYCYC